MSKTTAQTSLSLRKKIGQLFFIGLPGPDVEEISSELLEEISPGGICLFARNVRTREQVRQLLDSIRLKLETPPFLSLDQEGGLVDRLRKISTPMPAVSKLTSQTEVVRLAEITSQIIATLGFNMNFAPVVDVVDEKRSQFSNGLQSRAFGKGKEDVVNWAGAYLETIQNRGVFGCLKHFPGLGAAEIDSHVELPVVNLSRAEFYENELYPFSELFKTEKVFAVMIAHACFPNLDLQEKDQNGKLLPSSLSFNFITKLLREEMGFEGLAITDDLEMGAITNNYGIGEACKMAVRAGADLLAICANPESVRQGFRAVVDAVQSGQIPESRIDESIDRIFRVKSDLAAPPSFDDELLEQLSEKVAQLNQDVMKQHGG
ncbi:MAG: glycoside hydrolase family 3 N-terminal domain-containing protein [Pyrinomonadaceae bacterium]